MTRSSAHGAATASRRLGGGAPDPPEDIDAAEHALPATRAALGYAADRIERFHAAALPK
jgi:hypothetical protein